MTMEFSPSDGSDASGSDLRRSVGEATGRIHEIIDAAERVANEIRAEAEAEAATYLAERRREADHLAKDRNADLNRLTRAVADAAEQFKHQAERMLADLDKVVAEARAGVYRSGAVAAVEDESRPTPFEAPSMESPLPKLDLAPRPFESGPGPLEPLGPAPASFGSSTPSEAPEPERAPVSVYPGRKPSVAGETSTDQANDRTSEALLRATQLAVTGKDRNEIAAVLRDDFPGVDAEPLLDEILD